MNTKVLWSKWLGVAVLVALAALGAAGAVSAMVDVTPASFVDAVGWEPYASYLQNSMEGRLPTFDDSWTRFVAYLWPSVGQSPSGEPASGMSGNSWDRFAIYLEGSGQMAVSSPQDSWAAFQAYYWASAGEGASSLARSGKHALASMSRSTGNSWARFEQYLLGSGVAK